MLKLNLVISEYADWTDLRIRIIARCTCLSRV